MQILANILIILHLAENRIRNVEQNVTQFPGLTFYEKLSAQIWQAIQFSSPSFLSNQKKGVTILISQLVWLNYLHRQYLNVFIIIQSPFSRRYHPYVYRYKYPLGLGQAI